MIKYRPDLPNLPPEMIAEVYKSLEQRKNVSIYSGTDPAFYYEYMDSTEPLLQWCRQHIHKELDWAVQYIHGTIPAHTDWVYSLTKLNYLVTLGEPDPYNPLWAPPLTHWFDKDGNVTHSHLCSLGWQELTVNIPHLVDHVPGKRISVTHRSLYNTMADRGKIKLDPNQRESVKDYGFTSKKK